MNEQKLKRGHHEVCKQFQMLICYITWIKLCNTRKTIIRTRLAVRVIRLVVRIQYHTLKPAIHSRKKFGCVEPDQIERVEIERRERTVENGPCSELSGGEAGDYNAGEFGIVELGVFVGGGSGSGDDDGGDEEE